MTLSKVLPFVAPAAEDEQSLAARLERAEPAAVGRAYDEHHRAVRAFARRLLGDDAAAEDLVHDVFLALPRAARNFRGTSSLRTFLLGIAVNHARHHLRGAARRRAASEKLALEPRSDVRTPEQSAQEAQLAQLLLVALDTLSIDHRVAFVLCEVEERTSREAAEITGVPEATVRTRLHHAKKKLRVALEREGVR